MEDSIQNNICDQSNKENDKQIESCEYNIVQCKRCHIKVESGSLPSHTRDHCVVNEVSCKYSFCGCNEKFLKIDAEKHYKKDHSKFEKIHLYKFSVKYENQNLELNETDWGNNQLNYEVLWNYIKELEKENKKLKKFKDEEFKNGINEVKDLFLAGDQTLRNEFSSETKKIKNKCDDLDKNLKKKENEDSIIKKQFDINLSTQIEKLDELIKSTENETNDLKKKIKELNDLLSEKTLGDRNSFSKISTNVNDLGVEIKGIQIKTESSRTELLNEIDEIKKQHNNLNDSNIQKEKEYNIFKEKIDDQIISKFNESKLYTDNENKNERNFSKNIQNQLFVTYFFLVVIFISNYLKISNIN